MNKKMKMKMVNENKKDFDMTIFKKYINLNERMYVVIFDLETSHTFLKQKNAMGKNMYINNGEQISAFSYSINLISYDKEGNLKYEVLKINSMVLINQLDFMTYDVYDYDITEKNKMKMKFMMHLIVEDLIMLQWDKKSNVHFYSHNFFSFDSVFCMNLFMGLNKTMIHSKLNSFSMDMNKSLPDMSAKSPINFYKVVISTYYYDGNKKKKVFFIFKCSYKLTNMSLDNLCNDYFPQDMINLKKDKKFPHSAFSYLILFNMFNINFKNKDVIMLEKSLFENIYWEEGTPPGYMSWKKELNYLIDMKYTPALELKKYVENDVLILTHSFFMFMTIATSAFPLQLENKNFKVMNVFSVLTSPSLSLWFFTATYKDPMMKMMLPYEDSYKICSKTYYGGMTVKYSSSKDLNMMSNTMMFDYSSAYINSMMNLMPNNKPYIIEIKEDLTIKESLILYNWMKKNNLCFFGLMKIFISDTSTIQPIPYKDITMKKTIFPSGHFDDFYSDKDIEMLFFDKKNSFIIKKGKLVFFMLDYSMFKFGMEMYLLKTEYKQAGDPGKASFYKLMGNSLYGKIGASSNSYSLFNLEYLLNPITDLTISNISPTIHDYKILSDNSNTYLRDEQSYMIASQFMNKAVSSYITSNTRSSLSICNFKLMELYKSKVLYNDTDSTFFSNSNLKFNKGGMSWNQKMFTKKLDYLDWLLFMSPKSYSYQIENSIKYKLKGISHLKEMNPADLMMLLQNKKNMLELKDNLSFKTVGPTKIVDYINKGIVKEDNGKRMFIDNLQLFSKPYPKK